MDAAADEAADARVLGKGKEKERENRIKREG